ncbi:MAG: UvrD-helicase domain-containing protein [Paraclostridium sp.]|uniref:UvrD-helicase domain-containing protein n=1 Tax=Paraclostridium sp. TaxID=2023273 RepID=UPI003F3D5364
MKRHEKLDIIQLEVKGIEDESNKIVNHIKSSNKYLDKRDREKIEENSKQNIDKLIDYKKSISFIDKIMDKFIVRGNISGKINDLINLNKCNTEEKLHGVNKKFVNKRKEELKSFLDNVEGKVLDENQRDIILKDEINNLVVAGAGSGKTTVIVGKVEYLIKHCGYDEKDILVLSFTNKSASEMNERIVKSSNCQVDAMTFHKLGLKIIEAVDGKIPEIREESINYSIQTILKEMFKDNNFLTLFNNFYSQYMHEYKSKFDFDNLDEYAQYLKSSNIKSIKGEKLKSLEEVYIANFLYMNDIKYIYEKQYPYTKDKYRPDFYLPEYDIYLEHFGIDKNGNVPKFFESKNGKSAKEIYNEGIKWKRALHKEKHTKLIETYSYEQRNGELLSKLKVKLHNQGVKFNLKDEKQVFSQIEKENRKEINSLVKLIGGFISYMRANNLELATIRKKAKDENNKYKKERKSAFVEVLIPILGKYEELLRNNNKIDFSDMINMALKYVKRGNYISHYKYIIVDEYQDISLNRLELIKALRNQNEAKLFCVGDDWQSIYKFTGSEVSLFTDFEKYVGYSEISKIERTYRYNQSIVDVSSKFIQKNPEQIRKNIKGRECRKPALFLKYGTDNNSLKQVLLDTLISLDKDSSVLLIGRYNFDIRNFVDEDVLRQVGEKIIFKDRKDLDIRFMTVHKSKGLECDNVIVINTRNGQLGFPSKMEDDFMYELLTSNKNFYEYAEERRLFYVALTRTKNDVYLLVNEFDKSKFVLELEKEYGFRNYKSQLAVN